MARCLSLMDLHNTVVVCIPASCSRTNNIRYKYFSEELSQRLGAVNGFGHIIVSGHRQKVHISHLHQLADGATEYYHIDEDDKGSTAGMADLIIAKHRSGATDEVRLRFVKEFARFENPPMDGLGELTAGGGMQPNGRFDQGGSMIIDSKMNDDNFASDDADPF